MNNKAAKTATREVIQVDNEILDNISNLIEEKQDRSLQVILSDLHAADIAEIINHLKYDDARYVFGILDTETASEVITELDEDLREKILKEIDTVKIADIVDELDTDDATDIVGDLPEDIAEKVLDNIDKENSEEVKELLQYPEDSAGGLMSSDFVYVNDDSTIEKAIEQVRKHADDFEQIYQIYVLNSARQLIGFVSLKTLLVNSLQEKISSVMEEDLIYATPEMDQEKVAALMKKYDLVAIPVVNDNKVMLGRITIDDIIDVIEEEASEDMQMMAGLTEEEEFSHSTFRISRIRLPWLFVSLFGELISALVLISFQAAIEKIVIASFFIPIIMAMGGSSASQAALVMVQNLSLRNFRLKDSFRRLLKEFRVAIFNGVICGAILLLTTYLFFNSAFDFSFILALSLLIIMTNATMIGAVVPIILKRIGVDPAIGTGPFVQTFNDIIGLIIYFTLVTKVFA